MCSKDYVTDDIQLAAYLTLVDCELLNVSQQRGQFFEFHFSNRDKALGEAISFTNRQCRVEPRAFSEQVKSLKGLTASVGV